MKRNSCKSKNWLFQIKQLFVLLPLLKIDELKYGYLLNTRSNVNKLDRPDYRNIIVNRQLIWKNIRLLLVLNCCLLTSCCSTIDVLSQPPGARVLINGSDTGKETPAKFNVRSFKPGTYTFSVKKEGYTTVTQRQEIPVSFSKSKCILGFFPPLLPKFILCDGCKNSRDPSIFELVQTQILPNMESRYISSSPSPSIAEKKAEKFNIPLQQYYQTWAVVIGISDYQDSQIPDLRYAASDAQMFYDWLISPSGGKYPPARVK